MSTFFNPMQNRLIFTFLTLMWSEPVSTFFESHEKCTNVYLFYSHTKQIDVYSFTVIWSEPMSTSLTLMWSEPMSTFLTLMWSGPMSTLLALMWSGPISTFWLLYKMNQCLYFNSHATWADISFFDSCANQTGINLFVVY